MPQDINKRMSQSLCTQKHVIIKQMHEVKQMLLSIASSLRNILCVLVLSTKMSGSHSIVQFATTLSFRCPGCSNCGPVICM